MACLRMELLSPTAQLDTWGLVLSSHLPCHQCHRTARTIFASKPFLLTLLLLPQADSLNSAMSDVTFPWVLSAHLLLLFIPSLWWDDVLMLF